MTVETNTQAPEQQEQANPQLSINDLFVLRGIIDVCSTRGAFKANELTTVGTVFNKLDTFLKVIEEQQKAAEAEAVEETTGEE